MLILDAVDRIHGIEPHVAALLDLCPHLRILVTTRTTGKWQQVADTAADRAILSATELACTDVETATILNAEHQLSQNRR